MACVTCPVHKTQSLQLPTTHEVTAQYLAVQTTAAPIADQEAAVTGATQGEVRKHMVIFFTVSLQTILCYCVYILHCDLCSTRL